MEDAVKAAGFMLLLALGLAGCGDAVPGRPAPPAPLPGAQGPVNPDVSVVRYTCADGEMITAGYPDSETAVVTYKDHAYTLKLGGSASGARYTGYGLQWWTKGPHATIAALKDGEEFASAPGVDCSATQGDSAAESVTRTAFKPETP